MSEWISYYFLMALKAFEKALKKIQEGLATFFGKVVAFVLLAHLAAVFMLVLFSSSVFQKPVANKKKVAVAQVVLQPKKTSASGGEIASSQEAKRLEKTTASSSQEKIEKTSKKTAVSEKSAEKKVKSVKSAQEQKKQSPKESLIKTARKEGAKEKAKEKIAEAKQALSSSASFASLPKDAHMPIASLSSVSSSLAAESSFGGAAACAEDIVAEKMRTFLTLPEHGSVQIELTLSGKGEIEKIVIAQADSEKNRRYVEKSLKGMQFFEVASLLRGKRQTLLLLLTSK